ncbi:MAG: protease inhibitor I42 family protein [Thermoleophilia bacterium]
MSALRLVACAAVVLVAIGVAGCGDSEESADSPPAASTAAAPSVTGPPGTAPPSPVTGESVAGTPAVATVTLNPLRTAPDSLTVAVGQQFAVLAEENPSAGFAWTYLGSGIAATVVEDSSAYTPFDDTPEGRPGGGVREWRMTPTRAGEGWFDFSLARVADGAVGESMRLDITVTP